MSFLWPEINKDTVLFCSVTLLLFNKCNSLAIPIDTKRIVSFSCGIIYFVSNGDSLIEAAFSDITVCNARPVLMS